MHAAWQQLVSAPRLVIALDLDGTLIPFAQLPRQAVVEGEAAELIAALAALPGVVVGVISGRPRELLDDLPPRFPGVLFAAEHGVWRHDGRGWDAALAPLPQLDELAASLGRLAARHPGALVERKSCSVCLHWRSVDAERQGAIAAAAEAIVDAWLDTHHPFERLAVTAALEVRHRAAHKGTALGWLRARGPEDAPVLAIGDDLTDEDMFAALRGGDVGILIADHPRRTQARLRLPSPTAARRFLRLLVEARRGRPVVAPDDLVVA